MQSSGHSDGRDQRHSRHADLPRLQTHNSQDNRFSFTMTPAQAHAATFDAPEHNARPETIIDESDDSPVFASELPTETSPQTRAPRGAHDYPPAHSYADAMPRTAYQVTPQTAMPYQPTPETAISYQFTPQPAASYHPQPTATQHTSLYTTHPTRHIPYEPPIQHEQPHHERKVSYPGLGLNSVPSQEVHPAHRAPYAEAPSPYHFTPHSQASPLSPNNTNTYETTHSAQTQTQSHMSSISPTSTMKTGPYGSQDTKKTPPPIPLDFYSPYDHAPATPRTPSMPAFTPGSPRGPPANTLPFSHTPPQNTNSSHTHTSSKAFHSSTLAPSASCFSALFCPCIAYGRVQYRLSQRSKKAEPTDLLGYSAVNGQCGLMALACGLQGILAGIQRTRVRRAYGIDGDACGDCMRGCCCCCCTIGLSEGEITRREEDRRKLGAAGGNGGYLRTGTLSYMPPPR